MAEVGPGSLRRIWKRLEASSNVAVAKLWQGCAIAQGDIKAGPRLGGAIAWPNSVNKAVVFGVVKVCETWADGKLLDGVDGRRVSVDELEKQVGGDALSNELRARRWGSDGEGFIHWSVS